MSSLLPPGTCLYYFAAYRVQRSHCSSKFIEYSSLTLSRFPRINFCARKTPHEHALGETRTHEIDLDKHGPPTKPLGAPAIYQTNRTIIIPYQHTISHTVPHRTHCPTVPYHVPYNTHTVPTPPEGLNHARTQEEHAPRREHSSTNEYRYHTCRTNTTSMHTRSKRRGEEHYKQGKCC